MKRELVERTSSRTDRRQIVLALTLEGQSSLASASACAEQHICRLIAGLSPTELQALSQGLEILGRAFVLNEEISQNG